MLLLRFRLRKMFRLKKMWGGNFFLELGAAKCVLFSQGGRGGKVKKTRAKRALMRTLEIGTAHMVTPATSFFDADSNLEKLVAGGRVWESAQRPYQKL